MNFNHDSGQISSILTIDTTVAPPLGGSNTLQIVGTGGLVLPSGTTAQRPTGVPAGTQRWNSDLTKMETYNGSSWASDLGGTVTSVNVVTTATSGITVTSTGTGADGAVETAGTFTIALSGELQNFANIGDAADGPVVRLDNGTYVARVLQGTAPVIVTNGDGQAGDPTISVNAELVSLSTQADVGFVYRTGAGAHVEKTLAVTGDLTLDHTGNTLTFGYTASGALAGLQSQTGTGILVQTATDTYAARTVEGTASNIVVTNGDGVAANPVINLATVTQADSGNFVKVTLDSFGRVTGNTAVTTADITSLVDSTYVNVSGDTMTGNLAFGGAATVIGLTSPVNATDAATKGYVDSLAGGLSWQEPVESVVTTNPTSGMTIGDRFLNTTDGKIYTATSATAVDAGVAPADGFALFDRSTETGYVYSGTEWVQFTGAGQITAGVGLAKEGNVLNVNLGAGIAQLPTDEVGVDIYTGSALFLTTNGTAASTDTAAQLALRVGAGISQDNSNGIYIDAGAVTNAMLANSVLNIAGTSGTDAIALGETLTFAGATAPVTVAVSDNGVTVAVADATVTTKGLASFNTDQFAVTEGAVSLAADLEDLLNVDMATVAKQAGDLITWNGTKWVPISQNAVAPDLALDDLTDVVIATVSAGQHLVYNGTTSQWENTTVSIQAADAGLTSLAGITGLGFVVSTATDGETFATRTLVAGTGISIDDVDGSDGNVTISNTGVTSVALALPSIFTVSGSPVTTTGTLTGELATQDANLVFAGPTSGAAAAPTFRALVPEDVGLRLYKENGVEQTAPTASGANSIALGSAAGATLAGELAHASGSFAANGDAQSIELVLRKATTDGTETELFLDGASARAVLANNSAWTFAVQVIGVKSDGSSAAGYLFNGVALRGSSAANTSFVGTPSKNILGESSSAYEAVIAADTATGALTVKVTGAAATSMRWVATIRATQVKF